MARKNEALTPRQRQSQQIMREKAARKKRAAIMHKVYWIGGGLACVMLLGGSAWAWKSGAAVRTAQAMVDGVYNISGKAGFTVQALYLEGRNRTAMKDISAALDIKKGDPILKLSISEVRARLEAIESVKFAAVERALPGEIYVRIVEREPVAIWQNKGKMALVDDHGIIMTGIDITPYQSLPLIIGDKAPEHVSELMDILSAEPELAKRFSAAIRISDRRWNIRLNESVEVKLPERNATAAWKKLADMQTQDQLLDRDVKVIDLRLEGKMFIKVSPKDAATKAANARET